MLSALEKERYLCKAIDFSILRTLGKMYSAADFELNTSN
jgi:hypothetical protein